MQSVETKKRILVVDDEEVLCDVLRFNLEVEGYEVDTALSAEQALKTDIGSYDLVMLDIMMGTMSGFELAQRLKADPRTARIPVIFCTARDSADDAVTGLTIGADDYIAKPFSVREVVARVRAVLRRTSPAADLIDHSIRFEGLAIDTDRKQCSVDGTVVRLTRKELEVLTLFLSHRSTIFSREQILDSVWSDEVVVIDRTVDVTITRLRHKIGHYSDHIVTRHGYGYGFE